MNLNEIIAEADILVPNSGISSTQKIVHLNSLNQDFFNAVKIPRVTQFTGVAGTSGYVLSSGVKQRNIDLVKVGFLQYRDALTDDVSPVQNGYTYDDVMSTLTISPAPYQTGIIGTVRYHRTAILTLTTGTDTPEVPVEYHWTLVPLLAAFYADTQDDTEKAAHYRNKGLAGWNVAAQQYVKGGGSRESD